MHQISSPMVSLGIETCKEGGEDEEDDDALQFAKLISLSCGIKEKEITYPDIAWHPAVIGSL